MLSFSVALQKRTPLRPKKKQRRNYNQSKANVIDHFHLADWFD